MSILKGQKMALLAGTLSIISFTWLSFEFSDTTASKEMHWVVSSK